MISRNSQEEPGHESGLRLVINTRLEGDHSLDLDQPGRGVSTQEGSEDAGGNADGVDDLTERRTGNIGVRLVKVRVIQKVKELQPDAEVTGFVNRNVEVLGDTQVGVEVMRTPDLVSSLGSKGVDRGPRGRV